MNLFTLFNSMHTDSAKLALRDCGSAAAFQEVISLRNHLAKVRAGTLDPEGTDGSDDASSERDGDAFEAAQRTDQGNRPKQSAYVRAQLLHSIRLACTSELVSLGVVASEPNDQESAAEYRERAKRFARWNYPQAPAEALDFLCNADGKTMDATAASFDRLVEKNLLTREAANEAIRRDKANKAKQWADNKDEVLTEIDGLSDSDADGEEAFAELEPWAGLKLFDAVIKRMPGSLGRLVSSIASGYGARDGTLPAEAEAIGEIVSKDIEALKKARKAYYTMHKARIEADQPAFA